MHVKKLPKLAVSWTLNASLVLSEVFLDAFQFEYEKKMKYGPFCVVIVQLGAVNQEFQLAFFEKMKFRKKILAFTKAVGFWKFWCFYD